MSRRTHTTQRRSSQAGFTILELLVVVFVACVLAAFAMLSAGPALSNFKARGVLSKVQSQLASAREMAIGEQRDVRIDFVGTNGINTVRLEKPSGETVVARYAFEGGLIFTKVTGLPDSPDAWGGNSGALAFDSATSIRFRAGTGTLVDGTSLALQSGRVFVGVADQPQTAGVVSIFGATGRIRAYHWEGQWVY